MPKKDIVKILVQHKLKVTPQRIAILEVITNSDDHPDADRIIELLRISHPNIALGTVYYTLDVFTKKEIIKKVPTSKDSMRYDAIPEKHHHLYCSDSDRIEDYYDDELNKVLEDYMKKEEDPSFQN